jgi:hypothetical protein
MSFNERLRGECLNQHVFHNPTETGNPLEGLSPTEFTWTHAKL